MPIVNKIFVINGPIMPNELNANRVMGNYANPQMLFIETTVQAVFNRLAKYINKESTIYYPYSVEVRDRYGKVQYNENKIVVDEISTLRIVDSEFDRTIQIYSKYDDNLSLTDDTGLRLWQDTPTEEAEFNQLRTLLQNKAAEEKAKMIINYY
jgi:hypothetical protein